MDGWLWENKLQIYHQWLWINSKLLWLIYASCVNYLLYIRLCIEPLCLTSIHPSCVDYLIHLIMHWTLVPYECIYVNMITERGGGAQGSKVFIVKRIGMGTENREPVLVESKSLLWNLTVVKTMVPHRAFLYKFWLTC